MSKSIVGFDRNTSGVKGPKLKTQKTHLFGVTLFFFFFLPKESIF